MSGFSTPLLFIVFNRPESTERVFAAIRRQRPARLYVAADGPREHKDGEAALVERTRALATRVDWPCELKTLFRADNLGCGNAVSTAISWFFDQEEAGIILEDDCLPHPDFFPFCEGMLRRHRDDERVLSVSGNHFLPHQLHLPQSYYFSKYVQIWGWATWRRAWRGHDLGLGQRDDAGWMSLLDQVHPIKAEADYWKHIYRALKAGLIDTWDFQLMFDGWHRGGLHAAPARNLISNIGYGPDATHTNFDGTLAELPVEPLVLDETEVAVQAEPRIDNLIFYVRFLESMHQTWWAEQVLDPAGKLEQARTDAGLVRRELLQVRRQASVHERQNRLLAETLTRLQAKLDRIPSWVIRLIGRG